MNQIRVVVTGLDGDGRSTVVSDSRVDVRELPTGRLLHPLWGADAAVGAAGAASEPGLFPATGGLRFWLFTVRADEEQPNHALHSTPTIDLGYVVAGEMTLELEDGTEVVLSTGDAYVQNGTSHAWHNRGDVDATVALVVAGT
jgi:mannose-6-phosphate isomerase-like protein (cupin superfamily)